MIVTANMFVSPNKSRVPGNIDGVGARWKRGYPRKLDQGCER